AVSDTQLEAAPTSEVIAQTPTDPKARRAAADAHMSEASIVFISSLGHTLCHMAELVIAGALLAVMREFELGPLWATLLPTVGWVLMGAGAVPVGLWADAWGPRRVLMVYFLAMAAAALAVAFSPNVMMLFATLTLLGAV